MTDHPPRPKPECDAEVLAAIENFIAEPQTERSYIGSIAVGFELRRDLPKPFAGGVWLSAVAITELLRALRADAQRRRNPSPKGGA
jgi:hypothetical protein